MDPADTGVVFFCCRHRGQRDYKCGVCDFYGYTFTEIRKHIERRHSGDKLQRSYTCACGATAQSLVELKVRDVISAATRARAGLQRSRFPSSGT